MPDPWGSAEAVLHPDVPHWQRVIDEETALCIQFGVWEESALPDGKQALHSRMLLGRKRDGRYKARLSGLREKYWLHFEDTYPPVCFDITVPVILTPCAYKYLEIQEFNIRKAFLMGELEEKVYMKSPADLPVVKIGRGMFLASPLRTVRIASRWESLR